ncbi:hypothetical protein GN244_ATG08485 [Phytophthora infestans]|uniref:Uncharacterized protein n=1 Tax=Phytophthora infestans TaxID=4787 RepID=A0A833WET4_PHYIN|nr:hypothetical protein GN244_ATG08485 [Phytophthora infestans]
MTRGSTLSTDFTSLGSSRDAPRGDRESRQDNQRDVDEFIHRDRRVSSRWSQRDEPRTSDHERSRQRASASDSMSYSSIRYGESENYESNDKADSIRGAESPVSVRVASSVKSFGNEDDESVRKAPAIRTSSLAPSFENQDEQRLSRTNSETSISPASPRSDCDSGPQRSRDRYPELSISSPLPADRASDRRVRPSSPGSSVSATSTAASRKSSRSTESSMRDLRENLYAFRKQMREVFIRVEDMVDVHRSFFKSDPSTGTPIFREELEHEAEKLANETFEQLADLRKHFTLLSKDFQRSETATYEQSVPKRDKRSPLSVLETSPRPIRASHTTSIRLSDDENNSAKGSDHPKDDTSECVSAASENNDEPLHMEQSSSIRHSSQDSDDGTPRPLTSTNLSSQLESSWRKNSDAESIALSDISARTKTRAPSVVSDTSSIRSKREPDADSIFKDFDKRMEQIRCSLNAIASGKKPIQHYGNTLSIATTPKPFTGGGASSPIRAMMDVTRARTTLCEASRITRRLDTKEDDDRPRPGGREAELRQLLQELNHINSRNENEED